MSAVLCNIEVTNLKKCSGGKRICQGDLTIKVSHSKGESALVTLKECALVNGQEGLFLGLPQRNWTDKGTGEVRYVQTVSLPAHTQAACLKALQDAWEGQQGAPSQQPAPDPNDPFA